MQPVDGLDGHRLVKRGGKTFSVGPSQGRPGAVPAKRAASVGVAEIDDQMPLAVRRDLDHTVGADANATVAEKLNLVWGPGGRQRAGLTAIHKDKIVARALPLLKLQTHVAKVGCPYL